MATTAEDTCAGLLRRARTGAGLSLREAAARAGTSHPTLSAYESGRKAPGVGTLMRILAAYGFAADIELRPRVREADGYARGDELRDVLDLAEQFPARHAKKLAFPKFGYAEGRSPE